MQILDNTMLRKKMDGKKKKRGQQLNNALCRKLQCFPGLFVIVSVTILESTTKKKRRGLKNPPIHMLATLLRHH